MPRLAIIADIHGNMPALEAVLDDIAGRSVDEILVGGDLVGRGPEGNAVVSRIRGLGLEAIGGNHEEYVIGARRGALPDAWPGTDVWDAARFMAADLEEANERYLDTLPFCLARPGLLLVHGTPSSNREGIGPWTDEQTVSRHLADAGAPLLVCGHTHRPLVRHVAGGRVVNVGSVGLPFNHDPRAQYAIFERRANAWQVELRQVAYDLDLLLAIYESSGFLAAGGVTARLLRLEVEHASPLLVPFLAWAEATRTAPDSANLSHFLAVYQPGDPLPAFYRRLRALGEEKAAARR